MRLLAALIAVAAHAAEFADSVMPALEKAGCRHCHGAEGVAASTRLRFPEEGAPAARVAAFGDSLARLVDRAQKDRSPLLLKPTNRVAHAGGERIAKGSSEEKALLAWIDTLAALPPARMRAALEYRDNVASEAAQGAAIRRLTHRQYANTVRDLLKEPSDVSSQFPPEDFVDGFKNQYKSQTLSPTVIELYSAMAEKLAANAFRRGDSRKLIPCDYSGANAARCRSHFVASFGRRAFRRPLTSQETARYEALFRSAPSFLDGARAAIEGMLNSPAFLFRTDRAPRPEWKGFAAAARLSYFLWNTMPGDALLDSAAAGELDSAPGVDRAARRMLDHPHAKEALDEFVAQWLRFDRAFGAARERRTFPQFSNELVQAMAEEAKRFAADLAWNDRDFMDLFRSSRGYPNSSLAAVYGVPAPARDHDAVEFPAAQQRAGLLGQALFLTLTSKPEDTAPTSRGLFIREQFLCQRVPPPPANVDNNLAPLAEERPMTNKERLKEHTVNKACSSCHSLIDPLGFALENFDAIGARREKYKILYYPDEHEAKKPKKTVELDLETAGEIAGIKDSRYTGPAELGQVLARSRECQECIVKQVFRYMTGRRESASDEAPIRASWQAFRDSGFRYRELLISLVKSWDAEPRDGRIARAEPDR